MDPKHIIEKQIRLLRDKFQIEVYPNYIERVCAECDRINMFTADTNNIVYEQINLRYLGITDDNFYHISSLWGFNTYNGPIWYLIDPTYGQFFENNEFSNYMFTNYKDFCSKLLNDGYIEFNIQNLKYYLDGFIYACNLDKNDIYVKAEEYFKKINLFKMDIDLAYELNNVGITNRIK